MKCINAAEAAEEDFSVSAEKIYDRQSHESDMFSWLCGTLTVFALQMRKSGSICATGCGSLAAFVLWDAER